MNILLGVTGSVAATLTDKLVAALETQGHAVKVVVTRPATYFWRKGRWAYLISVLRSKLWPWRGDPMSREIFTDWDEWPGTRYRKKDLVLHIALRDWADALVIAPLSANTLAKLAQGSCDNLLTSVTRAWPPAKPLILAPAMNTQMWEHPATIEHLNLIERPKAIIIQPQYKKLACGDTGIGAMAHIDDIVQAIPRKKGRTPTSTKGIG